MTTEDELDQIAATTDRHMAAAKQVAALATGWKIERCYVANRGSVYVTFVLTCETQYITKLRIADHEQTSDNHAAADLTLIVSEDGSADFAGVAAAIVRMEDGGVY